MINNPVYVKKGGAAVDTLVVLNETDYYRNNQLYVYYNSTGDDKDDLNSFFGEQTCPDAEIPFSQDGSVTIDVQGLGYEEISEFFVNISIEGNKLMVKFRDEKK